MELDSEVIITLTATTRRILLPPTTGVCIYQMTTSVLPHVEARLPLFVPDQGSVGGELMEELRHWRTTRDSTDKDFSTCFWNGGKLVGEPLYQPGSSSSAPRPPEDLLSSAV
ncbi:unnamed protein product [Boreogadus saida]